MNPQEQSNTLSEAAANEISEWRMRIFLGEFRQVAGGAE
jgi:hypothetical protein